MGLFDKLFGGTKKNSTPEPPETNFTVSDAFMDEDQFWKIIQTAKDNGGYDNVSVILAKVKEPFPARQATWLSRFVDWLKRLFAGK